MLLSFRSRIAERMGRGDNGKKRDSLMPEYIIIETEDGMTVAEHDPTIAPEKTAVSRGGALVDEQVYKTFEDAYDAMLLLAAEDDDPTAE